MDKQQANFSDMSQYPATEGAGGPGYPLYPQSPPAYPAAPYPAGAPYPAAAPYPTTVTQQPTHTTVVVQSPTFVQHNSYLCWSIFSFLCCFWPLGLVAIIFSVMSRDAAHRGQVEEAHRQARISMWLNITSLVAGIIIIIIISVVSMTSKADNDNYYNNNY